MNIARRTTLIAIVPLALAVGAAFVAFAGRGNGAGESRALQHSASGALSVFSHRANSSDALPSAVLSTPAAARFGNATGARLAATTGSRRYFVVPGTGDSVCLIFVEGPAANPTSGGTCAGRDTLHTGAIYLSEPLPDGTTTVAGIVSDGIARVTAGSASAAVANNVFVLPNASASTVALDGPNVALDADIGVAAPASTVKTP